MSEIQMHNVGYPQSDASGFASKMGHNCHALDKPQASPIDFNASSRLSNPVPQQQGDSRDVLGVLNHVVSVLVSLVNRLLDSVGMPGLGQLAQKGSNGAASQDANTGSIADRITDYWDVGTSVVDRVGGWLGYENASERVGDWLAGGIRDWIGLEPKKEDSAVLEESSSSFKKAELGEKVGSSQIYI